MCQRINMISVNEETFFVCSFCIFDLYSFEKHLYFNINIQIFSPFYSVCIHVQLNIKNFVMEMPKFSSWALKHFLRCISRNSNLNLLGKLSLTQWHKKGHYVLENRLKVRWGRSLKFPSVIVLNCCTVNSQLEKSFTYQIEYAQNSKCQSI